jgi:hypothetical protein
MSCLISLILFLVTRLIKTKRETKQGKKDKEKLITAEKGCSRVTPEKIKHAFRGRSMNQEIII